MAFLALTLGSDFSSHWWFVRTLELARLLVSTATYMLTTSSLDEVQASLTVLNQGFGEKRLAMPAVLGH